MEIRHLRYVIAVAEELHFGHAAERLHISQPPLSMQIRHVEQELGVKLFERTKRNVQLTAAGRAFVDEARAVIRQLDHAAKVAIQTSRGEIGNLTLGTVTSTDSGFYKVLVDILHRFATQYPSVQLALRTLSVAQQLQDLKDGRIQVGFVTLPIDDPDIIVQHVYTEPLVAALPEKHPLASKKNIPIREFAREPHITFPRHMSPGYVDLVIAFFQKAGCRLNIVHEADTLYASLALVAAGMGVSLFPASLLDVPRKGIVVRRLKPVAPQMGMGVAYSRDDQS